MKPISEMVLERIEEISKKGKNTKKIHQIRKLYLDLENEFFHKGELLFDGNIKKVILYFAVKEYYIKQEMLPILYEEEYGVEMQKQLKIEWDEIQEFAKTI